MGPKCNPYGVFALEAQKGNPCDVFGTPDLKNNVFSTLLQFEGVGLWDRGLQKRCRDCIFDVAPGAQKHRTRQRIRALRSKKCNPIQRFVAPGATPKMATPTTFRGPQSPTDDP